MEEDEMEEEGGAGGLREEDEMEENSKKGKKRNYFGQELHGGVLKEGDSSKHTGLGIGQEGGRQRQMFSSPSVPVRNYDVFLNHRGSDAKKQFVDHLYAAFQSAGVCSFVDYEALQKAEQSWDAIVSAIHHSKVHIALFSPGYADSPWCLNELCEMFKCASNRRRHDFFPVFYGVEPSDLRSATSKDSCYSSAFAEHCRHKKKRAMVKQWKDALYEASNISGRTLEQVSGFEARLVKLIVSDTLRVLNPPLDVANHPVGVNEQLQKALDLMQIDTVRKGVHILGIVGMGGVGKTTLANAIHNKIYGDFESVSFIQNVRLEAKGLTELRCLQERMLRTLLNSDSIHVDSTARGKQIMRDRLEGLKVLIILDDVDDREQLEELLPPHDCRLKDGSQIVITTRDEQMVIICAQAQHTLRMEGLSQPDAHCLFSWHAFRGQKEPSEDLEQLAKAVMEACQGLPLALKVLGLNLYSKDIAAWKLTVEVLKGERRNLAPAHRDVTRVLRRSFDGLVGCEEEMMFLDIACFLLGGREDRAKRIWRDATDLCLENLKLKCLVKLDEERRLTMHDLLRDMGREIVESKQRNIWQRSHLWKERDVLWVLRNKMGTCDVQGLRLLCRIDEQVEFDTSSFAGMCNLRLLVLSNVFLTGDFNLIPKQLRWFQWHYCSLEFLPFNLCLEDVAVLDLTGSKIRSFPCDQMLQNLTELNLSRCTNLKELNLSCFKGLEMLDLAGCENLETIPDSVSCLGSSLTHLDLSGCSKLRTLPDGIADLRRLDTLILDGCNQLTKLPDAIGQLTALSTLSLRGCENLETIPGSVSCLGSSLTRLDVSGCSKLRTLPDGIAGAWFLYTGTLQACDASTL